jgi:hypothetical protein
MSCIAAQEMTTDPASLTIPDGTPVELQLTESVSSAHARVGDLLDFVVVKDVSIDGFTVIPAGTVASGSVTGVKGKRFLGIGGHVALKLDSVKLVNGEQVIRASVMADSGSASWIRGPSTGTVTGTRMMTSISTSTTAATTCTTAGIPAIGSLSASI